MARAQQRIHDTEGGDREKHMWIPRLIASTFDAYGTMTPRMVTVNTNINMCGDHDTKNGDRGSIRQYTRKP